MKPEHINKLKTIRKSLDSLSILSPYDVDAMCEYAEFLIKREYSSDVTDSNIQKDSQNFDCLLNKKMDDDFYSYALEEVKDDYFQLLKKYVYTGSSESVVRKIYMLSKKVANAGLYQQDIIDIHEESLFTITEMIPAEKVLHLAIVGTRFLAEILISSSTLFIKQREMLETKNKYLQEKIRQEVVKRMEQEKLLMQRSKLAAMGEMIGAIAHQWRQPLNSISLLIQEVKDAYDFNELTEEHINEIVEKAIEQTMYMSKTIDDFRNFYKPSKQKNNFNLYKCVCSTLSLLEAQLHSLSIKYFVDCSTNDNLTINSYESEFKQVLINIIQNAKDAIITARRNGILKEKEGQIAVGLRKIESKVRITVYDNGGTISENILSRLFEPYFTTKKAADGTGLGLYMSKLIVEKSMDGELYAENSNNGVVFIIDLSST